MPIKNYSTTPSQNNSAPPNGFPEGMSPAGVNDGMRQVMADIRSWYIDPVWIDFGDTPTQTGADTFTITGDVTSQYVAGKRIRCTDSSTLYGVIASSSFSSPNTTVTVTLDSGSLSASLSAVALNQFSAANVFNSASFGTAAFVDTGTSGATVPLLNGNNTHSGSNSFSGAFNTTTTATTRETYSYSTETDAGTLATRHRERWFANNASGTSRELLLLDTYYADATDGSEDTQARFFNYLAGTQRLLATWGAGLTLSNATGGDQGDGTINAKGFYKDGVEVSDKIVASVVFNGSGTVSILESFNVSSITDNGVGLYTINFTNALANANYNYQISCEPASDGTPVVGSKVYGTAPTTTALAIRVAVPATNAAIDSRRINVLITSEA